MTALKHPLIQDYRHRLHVETVRLPINEGRELGALVGLVGGALLFWLPLVNVVLWVYTLVRLIQAAARRDVVGYSEVDTQHRRVRRRSQPSLMSDTVVIV